MHDHRSRNIPVEIGAAIAAVSALAQEFGFDRPAFGAGLRSAARIDLDERATSLHSFIVEHRDQLRPSGVVNVLGEHAARQSFDVEVFNGNTPEPTHESSGNLMQVIASPVRETGVIARQSLARLFAPPRSPLAPCERPLTPTKASGVRLGVVWPRDEFPGRERGEAGKTAINTDSIAESFRADFGVHLQDDEPFAVLATDDRALGFTRKGAMPLDLDLAGDTHDADTARLPERQAVTNAKRSCVVSRCGTKAGEAGLFSTFDPIKEGLECVGQPAENAVLCCERPSSEVTIFGATSLQFESLPHIRQANPPPLPSLDPLLQASIVEPREVAKHGVQIEALNAVGIEPIFVGEDQAGPASGGSFLLCTSSHSKGE